MKRPDFITPAMLAELDRMHGDGSKEPRMQDMIVMLCFQHDLNLHQAKQAVTYWLSTMIKEEKGEGDDG